MRRIFRGILSLCLVLAMLTVGCMTGLCEEETDGIAFEPTIANEFEYSSAEWFSSGFNRALLTVGMLLDLNAIIDKNVINFGEAIAESTYVARDGINLLLYYHGEQNDLFVVYAPLTGEAIYNVRDKVDDSFVLYILKGIADDGCYKNDLEDIFEIVLLLADDTTDS